MNTWQENMKQSYINLSTYEYLTLVRHAIHIQSDLLRLSTDETFFVYFQTVRENTKNNGIIHLPINQNSF